MITRGHQRKGVASLPVSIFFIALVASAMVGVGTLASGQSGLANKQVDVENALASRQQELSGLSASTQTGTVLELYQTSGVATEIVYALLQEGTGQTLSEPVDYVVAPGQTITINVTSLAQSFFGGSLPSLTSVTFVTSRGLYITSQVQTVQQTKQVTTYQQEQVQEIGQRVSGYDVSETTDPLVGYTVTQTTTSSVLSGYDVTAHYPVTTQVLSGYYLYMTVAHTTYTCPSGWTNYQDGLCSTTYQQPIYVYTQMGYYCAFGIQYAWACHWQLLGTDHNLFDVLYTITTLKFLAGYKTVTTYSSATVTTTYSQAYEGFSSSCPSYAYQLGNTCDPVYATQTSYQAESLGQLSYCPTPNRYLGSYYT